MTIVLVRYWIGYLSYNHHYPNVLQHVNIVLRFMSSLLNNGKLILEISIKRLCILYKEKRNKKILSSVKLNFNNSAIMDKIFDENSSLHVK